MAVPSVVVPSAMPSIQLHSLVRDSMGQHSSCHVNCATQNNVGTGGLKGSPACRYRPSSADRYFALPMLLRVDHARGGLNSRVFIQGQTASMPTSMGYPQPESIWSPALIAVRTPGKARPSPWLRRPGVARSGYQTSTEKPWQGFMGDSSGSSKRRL